MKERTPTSQARTNNPFLLVEFSQGGTTPAQVAAFPPSPYPPLGVPPSGLPFPLSFPLPLSSLVFYQCDGSLRGFRCGVSFHSNLTSSFPSIGPHPRYAGDQDNWCSVSPFVSPSHNRLCW